MASISEVVEVAVPIPLYPYRKLFDYKIPEEFLGKVEPGMLVTVPIGARKSWGIVWKLKEATPELKIKPLIDIRFPSPIFSPTRRAFAEWLCDRYFYAIGGVCEAMLPAAVRKASQKLLAHEFKKKEALPRPELLTLNDEQQAAFDRIRASSKMGHLLWGVTGSGKTEIYLHLIRETLNEGKGAIVLVPEIALTPQLFQRFERAFPGDIALFHSAQSDKEQREEWLKVFNGHKKIALGPRSALFAPLATLGLVIVDEEHESSYKQEDRLRYHGRVSAEKLCELMGAKLVLGSATPSAETLQRALKDDLSLSKLNRRAVADSQRPEVVLVDLKKNLRQRNFDTTINLEELALDRYNLAPQSLFFSAELRAELEKVLRADEQAILFLNRRGTGRALLCRSCGYQPTCVQCAVNLVPHRTKLLCHYCGFECIVPKQCEKCNGDLKELGYGTQALEDELKLFFPEVKSLRLDRDVVQDRTQLVETLKAFGEKKANVLIGTQMVAKGHDFPQVSLVGVVLADVGFALPDFRNEERIFQLLIQVSGRAGRGQIPGKVVLQTFRPQEKLFANVMKGESLENFEDYIKEILFSREMLRYPPYSSLALLHFQGLYEENVSQAAHAVAQGLQKIRKDGFYVLGAVPAPILRVRNKFRYHVLVKAPTEEVLGKSLAWVNQTWESQKLQRKYNDTRMIIDVDPVSLV